MQTTPQISETVSIVQMYKDSKLDLLKRMIKIHDYLESLFVTWYKNKPNNGYIYQKASILTGLGNTKPSHIKLGINSCRTKSIANSIKGDKDFQEALDNFTAEVDENILMLKNLRIEIEYIDQRSYLIEEEVYQDIYQKASILRQGSAHVLTGLGNTKPSHIKLGINSCRAKPIANSIKDIQGLSSVADDIKNSLKTLFAKSTKLETRILEFKGKEIPCSQSKEDYYYHAVLDFRRSLERLGGTQTPA